MNLPSNCSGPDNCN